MKNFNENNSPSKISLPKGVIAPDNGKPVVSFEIPLTAAELDIIRNSLIKRHKIVLERICNLKREFSRSNAQIENNVLVSLSKKLERVKPEKRYSMKALDNEWAEILYCLEHSKSKSKVAKELIEFLTNSLGD